jgi:hypothetical protein
MIPQVQRLAAFLRALNALDNVRNVGVLAEDAQRQRPGRARQTIEVVIADAEDAIEVLTGGPLDLHPEAVELLDEALALAEDAHNAEETAARNGLLRQVQSLMNGIPDLILQAEPRSEVVEGDGDAAPLPENRELDGDAAPPPEDRAESEGDALPSAEDRAEGDGDPVPPAEDRAQGDGDGAPPAEGRAEVDGDRPPEDRAEGEGGRTTAERDPAFGDGDRSGEREEARDLAAAT